MLRLETGMYQDEAIGFYERAGFERCAAFGDYLDLSPQAHRDQRLLREADLDAWGLPEEAPRFHGVNAVSPSSVD